MLEVSLDNHPVLAPCPEMGRRGRKVLLREVQGHDELLDMSEPKSVLALIERLLISRKPTIEMPRLENLSLSDLDRIAAGLYAELFGDEIECQVACRVCAKHFSVSFSLETLWHFVREQSRENAESLDAVAGPDNASVYSLGDSVKFRLPTYADLELAEGLAPSDAEALVAQRCVLQGLSSQAAEIDRAMTLVGPRLDLDMDVNCAVCGQSQQVNFNIDQFLKAALQRERALVLSEVHVLAKAYRWSRSEILAMPRRDRRMHVQLVLTDSERGRARS